MRRGGLAAGGGAGFGIDELRNGEGSRLREDEGFAQHLAGVLVGTDTYGEDRVLPIPLAEVELVWTMQDTFNSLMVIPNILALFALSGVIKQVHDDYFKNRKK